MASLFPTGSGPVATIVNYYSSGGVNSAAALTAGAAANCKLEVSGSLTAATLATAYSLTGRGRLNLFAVYTMDATPRTIRVKITIDGTVVFDATSSSISNSGYGVVPVGVLSGTTGSLAFQPIDFQTSCLIEYASDLTESGKFTRVVNYETWS